MIAHLNNATMICDSSPPKYEPDEEWRRFMELLVQELHRKGERSRERVEALKRMLEEQGTAKARGDAPQVDDQAPIEDQSAPRQSADN